MIIAVSIMVGVIIVQNCLHKDAIFDYLHQHASAVRNSTIAGLQETHRKRIVILKNKHNQDMREAQDEIRRLHVRINHINSEHDYICTMYRDQTRCNEEQESRIEYLENKLKEFGRLSKGGAIAPFSAPASQITFANPPRRVNSAVMTSSPLAQSPIFKVQEAQE